MPLWKVCGQLVKKPNEWWTIEYEDGISLQDGSDMRRLPPNDPRPRVTACLTSVTTIFRSSPFPVLRRPHIVVNGTDDQDHPPVYLFSHLYLFIFNRRFYYYSSSSSNCSFHHFRFRFHPEKVTLSLVKCYRTNVNCNQFIGRLSFFFVSSNFRRWNSSSVYRLESRLLLSVQHWLSK